ncbi:MAG: phosphoenolpyruvate mutase [Clostridiaceae bacterium]|nr:phosphoenolpyruvate mutase [Clostridiaceae bacterium]
MINNMPENRRKKLKELLKTEDCIRVMEASNGLTALIVENASKNEKEFHAMWLSSLCDSTFKGKPDNEVVDFSSRINTINQIFEVSSKPLIVDGDSGGKIEHFVYNVTTLERLGVSAIVIEDKKGLKQNSLLCGDTKQILEDKDIFAEKIKKGKEALQTDDFMIFARIESFIANKSLNDALERADAYIDAGADGIMIHSYKNDGTEIFEFLNELKKKYPNIPVILVPTTYNQFTENQLQAKGANIVIYANHLLRSAYKSMVKTAEKILEDESSYNASNDYCVSMKEILGLIGDKND